jgi:DNA-binding transcriptional MerR regulator
MGQEEISGKLPEKRLYLISEVSKYLGVESFVLRYWETEFEMLKPLRTKGGQRRYRPEDIKLALKIKDLLYNQKYTIAGARRYLAEEEKSRGIPSQKLPPASFISSLRDDLSAILERLEKGKSE